MKLVPLKKKHSWQPLWIFVGAFCGLAYSSLANETLLLTDVQLSDNVALPQADGSTAYITPDGGIKTSPIDNAEDIRSAEIDTGGSILLKSQSKSVAIGKLAGFDPSNSSLDGSVLQPGNVATFRLLNQGQPQEISSTVGSDCTTADGQAGLHDQITFTQQRQDSYQLAFSSGLGSLSMNRAVNQESWTKDIACTAKTVPLPAAN